MNGKESTRDALLEAGVRLFGKLSRDLLRGMTSAAVAGEAGYHRQTFYRYWETQAQYVEDLVRSLLSPDGAPTADGSAVLPARRTVPLEPEDLLRDVARYDYARITGEPKVMVRIGLLAVGVLEEDGFSTTRQDFYDHALGRLSIALDDLLEAWDREPVPPFTSRDLVRLQQALLVGLVLQGRMGEDGTDVVALYEEAITRFFLQNTQGRTPS